MAKIALKTSLGRLPPPNELPTICVSPNCRRIAYRSNNGNTAAIMLDGQSQAAFSSVGHPVFSPDSRRLAYVANDGTNSFVVTDGLKGPPYDSISLDWITFSRDSKEVAYVAQKRGRSHAVIGHSEGSAFDDVGQNSILFTSQGGHHIYWAREGDRYFAVLDGRKGPCFDQISFGSSVFSPDGRRLLFRARKGSYWHAVMDFVECGPAYDDIQDCTFSPDSRRMAYVGATKDTKHLVVDRDVAESGVNIGAPVFSPDAKRLAYWVEKPPPSSLAFDAAAPQLCVIVDDRCFLNLEDLGTPVFSPDSKHVAFPFMPLDAFGFRSAWLMAVDEGAIDQPFDDVRTPIFRRDSKRIAFVAAKDGKSFLVEKDLDHSDLTIGPPCRSVHSPVFVSSLNTTAYFASCDHGAAIMLAGSPCLSCDGSVPGSTLALDDDSQLHTIIVDRGEIFLVELRCRKEI